MIGIGIAHFTEAVGAGPSHTYDIAGLKMFDSAELRVHPTGKAILKLGVKSQGQGHETTFAQIVAEELGIPVTDIKVMEGDTDNTPYGLGTYASRSTPVAGAATAMVSRKLAEKAKIIAAHLLEASSDDIELQAGKFYVRGTPSHSVTIQDVALAAYTNCPKAWSTGWRACTTTTRRTSRTRTAATSWSWKSTPRPACGRCGAWSRSTTAVCASTR